MTVESGSAQQGDLPDRIVGGPLPMTRRQQVTVVVWTSVGILVAGALALLRHRETYLMLVVLMLVISTARLQIRRRTVIDQAGIHRPWGSIRISWADVESVVPERPGFPWVRVNLDNGRTVQLSGFPASRTAAVAAVGGKELRDPAPPPRSPVRPAVPTAEQIENDVTQRAEQLAAQRADLAALNWRYRRDHPGPPGP